MGLRFGTIVDQNGGSFVLNRKDSANCPRRVDRFSGDSRMGHVPDPMKFPETGYSLRAGGALYYEE